MTRLLLQVENLTKRYYGTIAVDRLSFGIEAGTITGLIGPNGSGKSTTIDCISGFQRADSGRWTLDGLTLTGASAEAHARAGLMRTFQMIRIYDDMSVMDNLLVAAQSQQGDVVWWQALLRTPSLRRAEQDARARAAEALAAVSLGAYSDAPAQVLSYGQRKLLSIATLILCRPKLAILDEPVSGINPTMIARVGEALKRLRAAGTTILLVEHNMDFLMSLSDHVIVLVGGSLMAQGAPAAMRADPRVLDAYLGGSESAA